MERMKSGASLTVSEAADLLGVSPATIRRAVDRGDLPGFRIPGSTHRRISKEAVEAIRAGSNQQSEKSEPQPEAYP